MSRRGHNLEPYQYEPKYDYDKQPLGQQTDRSLAEQLGVGPDTIARQRKQRGIPPFSRWNNKKNIDWDAQPLGQYSDYYLARKLHVSLNAVASARRRRKIKAKYSVRNNHRVHFDNSELLWLDALIKANLQGRVPTTLLRRKECGRVLTEIQQSQERRAA